MTVFGVCTRILCVNEKTTFIDCVRVAWSSRTVTDGNQGSAPGLWSGLSNRSSFICDIVRKCNLKGACTWTWLYPIPTDHIFVSISQTAVMLCCVFLMSLICNLCNNNVTSFHPAEFISTEKKSWHWSVVFIKWHRWQSKTQSLQTSYRRILLECKETAVNCVLVMQWDVPMEMSILIAY